MDEQAIESRGVKPVAADLALIDSIHTRADLIPVVAALVAAIDPVSDAWKARGTETVKIDAATAQRLGTRKTELTLTELVSAVKYARLAP